MIQIIIKAVENWVLFMAVCFAVYILFIIALRRIEHKQEQYGVGRVADLVEKIKKYGGNNIDY